MKTVCKSGENLPDLVTLVVGPVASKKSFK